MKTAATVLTAFLFLLPLTKAEGATDPAPPCEQLDVAEPMDELNVVDVMFTIGCAITGTCWADLNGDGFTNVLDPQFFLVYQWKCEWEEPVPGEDYACEEWHYQNDPVTLYWDGFWFSVSKLTNDGATFWMKWPENVDPVESGWFLLSEPVPVMALETCVEYRSALKCSLVYFRMMGIECHDVGCAVGACVSDQKDVIYGLEPAL